MKDVICENDGQTPSYPGYHTVSGNTQSMPVDIEDVKINLTLSREERIRSYIQQIGDPYQFRCKGVVVRIAFSDTDETIEDLLESFLRRRQMQHIYRSGSETDDTGR